MVQNIAIGLVVFAGVVITGGLFFLGIVWFNVNHHWRGPLSRYIDWLNRKTHNIRAKAEAKRLSDEWRELNERSKQE